ncbi:MAG TPA: rhomboid family intramembrane serine protease [Aestuariivirga sp.]|nr:rhomboid family intramembrane serine protease [Aestuariivirga sp.]
MKKVAGVDLDEQGDLAEVRRCPNRRQAEQYALVLTAMGIQSLIVPEGKFTTLYVAHEDAARANDELAAYDSENRQRPPERERLSPALPRVEVAMVYWVVLLFFFAAARHEAFSFDWLGAGAAQAGLMLKGEWWRAVTALCLHESGAHLLGNLVFGTVFLMLLSQVTGAGVAALAMITAGAAGNVLSALVRAPEYTSIGASTAIFAGIGLLAGLRLARRRHFAFSVLRSWTPVAGGLALLAFLGLSGENTDVLAHVLGFGSGIAAGLLLARWDRDWTVDRGLQWTCAAIAAAVVVSAWVAALSPRAVI